MLKGSDVGGVAVHDESKLIDIEWVLVFGLSGHLLMHTLHDTPSCMFINILE